MTREKKFKKGINKVYKILIEADKAFTKTQNGKAKQSVDLNRLKQELSNLQRAGFDTMEIKTAIEKKIREESK